MVLRLIFPSFMVSFAFGLLLYFFIYFLLHSFFSKFLFILLMFHFHNLLFGRCFVIFFSFIHVLLIKLCSQWEVLSFEAPYVRIRWIFFVYVFWFSFVIYFDQVYTNQLLSFLFTLIFNWSTVSLYCFFFCSTVLFGCPCISLLEVCIYCTHILRILFFLSYRPFLYSECKTLFVYLSPSSTKITFCIICLPQIHYFSLILRWFTYVFLNN